MQDMVEVVIDSIRVSLMSQQRIVILREKHEERYLPIWIGVYEAESITIALQEVEVSRPLTHDLIRNIIQRLNGKVTHVEVVSLQDDTFFGNIIVEVDGNMLEIDARPSDALAVAVRTNVPILVDRNVMNTAGIVPEEDLQERDLEQKERYNEAEIEDGEDRLSIFEDFLQGLDSDSDEDNGEDQEPDEGNKV
jgi:bifunctional DNase/RNase